VITYWVARAREKDWKKFRKYGFLVLRPAVPEYVFIEKNETNQSFWKRQEQFGIKFVIGSDLKPVEVSEEEIKVFRDQLRKIFSKGAKVKTREQAYVGLDGVVIQEGEGRSLVEYQGWLRKYKKWCDWEDLTSAEIDELTIEDLTNPEDMV